MNNDSGTSSDSTSPPTVELPPDDLAGHQASWPTVIGIISIVYAAFGFFANGCGTAFVYIGNVTLSMMGLDAADFQVPVWLKVVQTTMGVFGMTLAILLLMGAIGLMRRKPSSVRLLRTWAVLAIVSTLVGIGIGFAAIGPNIEIQRSIQEAVLDKVKEDGGDPNAPQFASLQKDDEAMRMEAIRNLAIFGAMPMIYPLIIGFLLTGKRRAEQVEHWSESGPVA